MASNDFDSVAEVLHGEFVLEWPQSGERIRGARNFALVNREYPAAGPWTFTVHRIVAGQAEAVSDVTVSDGVVTARAVSFFSITAAKIERIVEFWPEPFGPQANRARLVEIIN